MLDDLAALAALSTGFPIAEIAIEDHDSIARFGVSGATPAVTSYAAIPLRGRGDAPIGTVAVMDVRPRSIEGVADPLERVARLVAEHIAERRESSAKSELLAIAGHELRTPLTAIMGFARLLTLEDLSPAQRHAAARIASGGKLMLDLARDVLDAGRLSVSVAPVALGELVERVADLLEPLAAESDTSLEVNVVPLLGHEVLADPRRVEQILINLTANAIKFGPEGSVVRIGGELRGSLLRLTVDDAGEPIARADRERLFVPFERLPASAGVEGAGLGLALSRTLARAMGGSVGAVARHDGNRFWLELPLASVDHALAQGEGDRGGTVADGELLVDVLEVGLHRPGAQEQDVGDLGGRAAAGRELEDLSLARGQRAGGPAPPPRY